MANYEFTYYFWTDYVIFTGVLTRIGVSTSVECIMILCSIGKLWNFLSQGHYLNTTTSWTWI